LVLGRRLAGSLHKRASIAEGYVHRRCLAGLQDHIKSFSSSFDRPDGIYFAPY
jgi:hypothetical protein